jgi:putative transposase
MKELYVSSDSEFANYPRFYRENLEKLAKAQRKLSKMVKKSKNYYKQRHKVAIIHERIANMRNDFLHNKSKQITNVYDLVAIEDLNMKGMQQALNFGKSVSDNSWGNFVNLMEYKLMDRGKKLIKVDKWFPSSKTCSICGSIKKEMPLDIREFECCCGNKMDRDINAAINIREEGLRILALA